MSAIFGFIDCVNNAKDAEIEIKKMQLWNRAYGRESEEVIVGEGFGFGCCYEKLSADAKQSSPVLRINNRYSVIDALLYNRDELIEKCQVKETLSDEELLLCYIDCFGIDALKDVNGDFCGAVYDENEKSLLLFCDHMGVRPLFYFARDEFVAFSTDVRGLVALPQVDTSISEEWLFKMIAGYSTISAEATEFAHIFSVEAAGYIKFVFGGNGLKTEKNIYWQLGSRKIRLSSEAAYRDKLRELIEDAVKRRLDVVPGLIGAELSGGLDSGVIDILINRFGREGVYFSWSADPTELPMAENDERLVIADICEQENITCSYGKIHLEIGEDSNIAQSMREIGVDMDFDEEIALRYVLPAYSNTPTICETGQHIAREGARVVFTGHGGDEGVSHRCNPYEMFYHREYYRFFRYMWSTTHGQKNRMTKTLKKCYEMLGDTGKEFKKPFQMINASPELLQADFGSKFDANKMPILYFAYDPKEYIKGGASRDRLANMALQGAYSGVRYMAPYLDYRVIDFAVSIPRYLYLKGRRNRYIFREAFKDIMPKSLYTLRIKEDNSRNNVEEDPDWYEKFAKRKSNIVSKLNRTYWGAYLNFEVIDEWVKRDKPSEEERIHDERIFRCLFYCAVFENVVRKSREI